jgi:hypothetical protein
MAEYADQRAHDVTWMTAAERAAYERRLAEHDAAVERAGGPYEMTVDERGKCTITWWWQR